jgi:hypothetical protein
VRNTSSVRQLLQLLDVHFIEACADPGSLDWMLVETVGEPRRRFLILERTFRDGVRVVANPSDDEIATCRIDPWRVWNTQRSVFPFEILLRA